VLGRLWAKLPADIACFADSPLDCIGLSAFVTQAPSADENG
jgi:hypothetical protein